MSYLIRSLQTYRVPVKVLLPLAGAFWKHKHFANKKKSDFGDIVDGIIPYQGEPLEDEFKALEV